MGKFRPTNQAIPTENPPDGTSEWFTDIADKKPKQIDDDGVVTEFGGGETNTASNVGTAGVGIFKQKTGVDLEFKKLNAGSTKVTISDDTGNDEVDIDVDQTNIDHDLLLNYVLAQHRIINDAGSSTTDLLSASKILAIVSAADKNRDPKDAVVTVATSNVTLSGEQTLSGFLTSNSRVGVVGRSDASENAIYITDSGAWTRAVDADEDAEVTNGLSFFVSNSGSTKNGSEYLLITQDPIVLDTTDLTFIEIPRIELGTTAGTAAEGNDSRILTQDENDAAAGTGTPSGSNKFVTEDTVSTETVKGIAEIATQAETDAGTDDLRFVTPLKLKNTAGASVINGRVNFWSGGTTSNKYLKRDNNHSETSDKEPYICPFDMDILGLTFINKIDSATIDIEIEKNAVVIFTWNISAQKRRIKTNGLGALQGTFSAGDKISVFAKAAGGTSPEKVLIDLDFKYTSTTEQEIGSATL